MNNKAILLKKGLFHDNTCAKKKSPSTNGI